MKNIHFKNLQASHRNIFRALHQCFGFDFQSPFGLIRVDGSFTTNKLLKLASEDGCPEDALRLVLVEDGRRTWVPFDVASLSRNGSIDIDLPAMKRRYGVEDNGLDTFYAKKDFEKARKGFRAVAYVLWQDRRYLKPVTDKPMDKFARYTLENLSNYSYGEAEAVLRRVNDGKVEKYTIFRSQWTDKPEDILDKSGYFLPDRRSSLKTRAFQLHTRRLLEAAAAIDCTDRITSLAERILARRDAIADQLRAATTPDELEAAGKAILGWDTGLREAVRLFDVFTRKAWGKGFVSPADCDDCYNRVVAALGGGAAT